MINGRRRHRASIVAKIAIKSKFLAQLSALKIGGNISTTDKHSDA
jgi:hypothetical protein